MNIELNFNEVIQTIKKGETYECTDPSYTIREITMIEQECIETRWGHSNKTQVIANDARFKLKQTSVTFMEAVASGKNVRVDMGFDGECESDEYFIKKTVEDFENGKYISIGSMMLVLGWMCDKGTIEHLIQNGKWYVED